MQGVMRDRVQHASDAGPQKPFRKDLVAAMPEYIKRDLPSHEYGERHRVDRNRKHDYRPNAGLDYRLGRTERVSGPGCGARRPMMSLMQQSEQPAMVHQTMRPVKISVVNDDHHPDAQHKPSPSVIFYP